MAHCQFAQASQVGAAEQRVAWKLAERSEQFFTPNNLLQTGQIVTIPFREEMIRLYSDVLMSSTIRWRTTLGSAPFTSRITSPIKRPIAACLPFRKSVTAF